MLIVFYIARHLFQIHYVPQELKVVLDRIITMVSFIKSKSLKSRLFKQLYNGNIP